MKIEVTAEDIATGVRHDPFACVIGLAVARAFNMEPFGEEPSPYAVFGLNMRLRNHHFGLPPKVTEFIYNWEDGQEVEPFSFTISDEDVKRGEF